jgi:hypothetical protein
MNKAPKEIGGARVVLLQIDFSKRYIFSFVAP